MHRWNKICTNPNYRCRGSSSGAHEGKGPGNKFLDDARQADALIHVIDVSGSTDSEGRPLTPSAGDPLEDIRFVEKNLIYGLFQLLREKGTI